jgi:hypothetical protein
MTEQSLNTRGMTDELTNSCLIHKEFSIYTQDYNQAAYFLDSLSSRVMFCHDFIARPPGPLKNVMLLGHGQCPLT